MSPRSSPSPPVTPCGPTLTAAPARCRSGHPTHLLAGSEAGGIAVWRVGGWGERVFWTKVRSAPATAVAWAPDGGRYLLVTDKVVSVYLATGELAASLEHPKRVLAAVFTSPVGVATAGEERVIKVRWGMGGWGGCA
ncbi:hypothetical protein I4F81_008839 [Pyropia yezoensis]|uniref:Uncharacterized protein n=1 Tax=Pyropia yezoensis TaxID=2788 RepID=A0ACC3C8P5_PYRYE|nr:hypothetical protein I4F81_008839 [Neopyropia yezoensis]